MQCLCLIWEYYHSLFTTTPCSVPLLRFFPELPVHLLELWSHVVFLQCSHWYSSPQGSSNFSSLENIELTLILENKLLLLCKILLRDYTAWKYLENNLWSLHDNVAGELGEAKLAILWGRTFLQLLLEWIIILEQLKLMYSLSKKSIILNNSDFIYYLSLLLCLATLGTNLSHVVILLNVLAYNLILLNMEI